MNFTLQEIARIIGADITGTAPGAERYTSLLTDSRSLAEPAGCIFCALRTGSSDGHLYLADMARAGIGAFIVEQAPTGLEGTFLAVPSVDAAISRLGAAVRDSFDGTLVAVTGSAGKTVVKEMLHEALAHTGRVFRSPRSWNSLLGVPLSLIEMPADATTAIIEVGIDRVGDMAAHAAMLRPQVGILTTITSEHDAGFASREQKIREKALLFASCHTIIFDDTEPDVRQILSELYPAATLIGVKGRGAEVDRAIACRAARVLGAEVDCTHLAEVSSRLDIHEGVNDCLMIFDNFSHDLRSLHSALDFMRRRAVPTRLNTLILADFSTAQADESSLYRRAADLISAFGIKRLITVGPASARQSKAFAAIPRVDSVASVADFLRAYDINSFSSETILISGVPGSDFADIKALLATPRHDTIFEINLDAVVHNFNYYRSLLRPGTGLVAMVKASAYGTGSIGIAKTLQAQGASYLAVAVIDEGVELRRSGITMPIMVLNPITTNYRALFENHLEPSVFSLRELDTLITEARRCGVTGFPVHIKLDTGMHRVGFLDDDLEKLAATLRDTPELRVASIFSHIATADCLDMDDYTEMQLRTFREMSTRLMSLLPYPVKRHILNTAGIMRYPDDQYDMVRLGIGLYGISPLPGESPLRPIASLRTTVISLKTWPAGTTIGYGRRGLLTRPSVIATVPIGYADGLDRHLSCGAASFIVRGVKTPTVGNICMDQCMIDVTDVPGVAIGDSVEIFGEANPVQTLADTLGTIPYELLTSVSPRVKRIYFRE